MTLLRCESCRLTIRTDASDTSKLKTCPTCRGPLTVVDSEPPAVSDAIATPPMVKELALDPARRFGRFIIVRAPGRGAIGTVQQAWDTGLSRWVAIKVLKTGA